jgi:hypothetical protein
MNVIRASLLTLIGVVLSVTIGWTEPAQAQQSIQINENGDNYELSVPISRLTMSVPKDGLMQDKSSGGREGPTYFYLQDPTLNLIISGWFEPEAAFAGIKKLWQSETEAWSRRGLPAPQRVTFEKIEGWEVILYDIPFGPGSNSHIRAQWVEGGTWIDLHLSITSRQPSKESRDQLMAVLKAIKVSKRN